MAMINRTHNAWLRVSGFALVLAALGLAGCGGGGYGGGSSAPPPTLSLTVQPTTIVLGQSATLSWNSSTGASCVASGAWNGAEATVGTKSVTPAATGSATYTLTCSSMGAYGGTSSKTSSVTLTVTAPSAYSNTALVADVAGNARTVDAKLVNPWGIAFSPASASQPTFAWVANNHSETSTLYDGNGVPQPAGAPLSVALPPSATAVTFDPTGVIFNPSTTDFVVGSGASAGASIFVFTGEGGMIAGWSPTADTTHAITMYTDAGGAVYKGLALASNGGANFLYAADFHNGKIDVFDSHFQKQATSATRFAFSDPMLPANYAPFGIQAIDNGTGGATQLYVSYAQQVLPDRHDNVDGAGLGLVDIYDTNGVLLTRLLLAGGKLNAPWGFALAPSDFGTLSGKLLVGNFGDGIINAFDPATGAYAGAVADSAGTPIATPGLWGIAFGNDAHNQPHNTLFYAAGTNNEANGVYGRIDVGSAPTLGAAPVVTITAPTGTISGNVAVTATATDPLGIAKVQFFANATTALGTANTAPFSVQWDTTTIADGSVSLTATATDADGNVGTSAPVSVTVANHAVATTLTQIQAAVFTPICSGCHNGSQPAAGALPGSQNLTAGNSFSSLVNVASHEQPALLRVKPGDANNSYLIQKLEGAAGITGARMPLGGPFLDQATIDQIKSWIAAGAPNN
jgi:uncharacterized protein (TIGR03118 family)